MEKLDQSSKNLVIFIMGTSAVGKTKLSLALANTLKNCEVVNCDSMQLYKDANIMTAKATKEEQSQIKHHLLDMLDISKNDFTRISYIETGTKLIEDLLKSGVTPIVVGGTHYYLEGLLFKDEEILQDNVLSDPNISSLPDLGDYNKLKEIDPVIANKIHPNDTRRIRNYLVLYNTHKMKPSDFIKECEFKKTLRYDNSIILWPLMENSEILKEKASLRIEEMVNREGIIEIIKIYEHFCSEIKETEGLEHKLDFTKGVLQAIGYKEFFPFYLEVKKLLLKLNWSFEKIVTNEKESDDFLSYILQDETMKARLKECKEMLLIKTIKYTKKQLLWIENRLLPLSILEKRTFKFPFSNYEDFEKKVMSPACEILSNFKKNFDLDLIEKEFGCFAAGHAEKNKLKRTALEDWKKFYCEICEYEFNGTKEWESHLKSRIHSKKKQKIERGEKLNDLKKKEEEEKKEPTKNVCYPDGLFKEENDRNI